MQSYFHCGTEGEGGRDGGLVMLVKRDAREVVWGDASAGWGVRGEGEGLRHFLTQFFRVGS
jgi:hypothetical protein